MSPLEMDALAGAGLTPAIDRLDEAFVMAENCGSDMVILSPGFALSLIKLMERCRDTLESQSDEIAAARNHLHAAIMNLPSTPPERSAGELRVAYKLGHRDARHAAAELAIAPRSQS